MHTDLFDYLLNGHQVGSCGGYPAYDVIRTSKEDDTYQIRVVLNGAKKENIKIKVDDEAISIKHDAPKDRDEGIDYIRKGISTKSFDLKIAVVRGQAKVVKAVVEEGILVLDVQIVDNSTYVNIE